MTHTFARLLTAGLCGAALLALPLAASAGDYEARGNGYQVDNGYPVPQPPPPGAYRDEVPPHQSYKDDAPPPPPRRVAQCLSKYGIRGALNEQGWHAFDRVEIRGPVAFMTASNDRGRRFELQVDSCNGSVIEAHPLVAYYDAPPPPPVYYGPRPAVGLYFGGGYGYGHRHWR